MGIQIVYHGTLLKTTALRSLCFSWGVFYLILTGSSGSLEHIVFNFRLNISCFVDWHVHVTPELKKYDNNKYTRGFKISNG